MSSGQARRSSSGTLNRADVIRREPSARPDCSPPDCSPPDCAPPGCAPPGCIDVLAPLLDRLALRASTFFIGTLCGSSDTPPGPAGQIHLLRRGGLRLRRPGRPAITVTDPSLILFAHPTPHGMDIVTADGADLVCAHVDLGSGPAGGDKTAGAGVAGLLGLPEPLIIARDDDPGLRPILDMLFDEAFGGRPGHRAAVDRLLELLVLVLVRHRLATGQGAPGLMAALADPRLAAVLQAVHAGPGDLWTLERLAAVAGMSRASFAATFKAAIGVPPGDYVTGYRLSLVKQGLRAGRSLKTLAARTGYASPTALARMFRQRVGVGPRDWVRRARPDHPI